MIISLAGGIIFDQDGRILLIHRNTEHCVQWELPGGKVEKNEKPQDAAVRELMEELGVHVKIERDLGAKSFIENDKTMNYFWYKCNIKYGIPKIEEKKFDEIRYWDINELKKNEKELSANMKNLLPVLLSGIV